MKSKNDSFVLLISVFVIAICALIYELIAGAVSSYLLGNSVTQFSVVIGIFLSAMGIGSFLTKFIDDDLISWFVIIEIIIGLAGGFSSFILFYAFTYENIYMPVMVIVTGSIGILIGLEIPLLIRILKEREDSLKITVANVMTVDYIGALVASLLFPFILVPFLGLMHTAFLFGLLNLFVAWLGLSYFKKEIKKRNVFWALNFIATLVLLAGFFGSNLLVSFFESQIYPDEIIFAKDTPYQRIVITKWKDDIRLFLDQNIQFSTKDEYRYHESLVHPAMNLAARHERILILGGGDGMAAREILKYDDVRKIDLVDIDPAITEIFKTKFAAINNNALQNPKVNIINDDAMNFLEKTNDMYDVVFIDLPDPSNISIGKLYSKSFYQLLAKRLDPKGIFSVQCSSPYFASEAFWCIVNTINDIKTMPSNTNFFVKPYHVNVPAFGIWGYTLASPREIDIDKISIDKNMPMKFLNTTTTKAMFEFPNDMKPIKTEINKLNNQILVKYYQKGYKSFND